MKPKRRTKVTSLRISLFVFSLTALVSSCGGTGGNPAVDDPSIARVEITPGSVMQPRRRIDR
jgi:hypothetical protein